MKDERRIKDTKEPDFSKLLMVHEKARRAGVGFTLVFCESDLFYYFSIDSAAPSEEWHGKGHSFDIAVECVCAQLDKIGGCK